MPFSRCSFRSSQWARASVARSRAARACALGVVRVPGELVALAGGRRAGPARGRAARRAARRASRPPARTRCASWRPARVASQAASQLSASWQHVLVGALLTVQVGALRGEFGEPALGAARRLQAAQLLGRLARGGREPGARRRPAKVSGRAARARASVAAARRCSASAASRRSSAGATASALRARSIRAWASRWASARSSSRAARSRASANRRCSRATSRTSSSTWSRGGLRGLGGRLRAVGDGEPFAGGAAGDGGPAQDGVGEAGVARREVGQRHSDDVAGGLLHAVGVGEQLRVPVAHFGLGGAPSLGEPLLDLGEAVGVEEAAEQLAAGLGVGPQEAREVALGQQHDLAELLAAHAEQLGDLLADLLVGAAEVLPGARRRVVLAQPALCLVGRGARAALLGALPGRLPGDLQPASGDGEFEGDLGAGGGRRVVAAQGHARPLWRAPGTDPYSA